MKTIVCPFDNSAAATHALDYAKHLSRNTRSQLTLFKKQYLRNLFRNLPEVLPAIPSDNKANTLAALPDPESRQAMAENAEPVMQMQSVCTIATFAATEHADLIVAGTETAFCFNDLYTGTIADLIRRAKCPLLLIPEGVTYKPIRQMVVVIEHETNISHRFDLLLEIAGLHQAAITFLQVTREEIPNQHFLESWREMYLAFPYQHTDFVEVMHSSIPTAIRDFVKQVQADMVVVIPNGRTAGYFMHAGAYTCQESSQEALAVPVLALDSIPIPAVDIFHYN